MDYKIIAQQVAELAKEVGLKLMQYRKENAVQVEIKGKHDFVTQMDKYSEKLLVEGLSQILPEAGYIAEEGTRTDRGEKYNWVIDPIDGTTNFIHGVPPHAISVALMEGERVVVGVIYELCGKELFVSSLGGGAFLNGEQMHVSRTRTVEESLVSTGFPYSNFERLQQYMKLFMHFTHHSSGLRRHGSAATDLAYVAAGRFDAFFEYDLKPYDVAAGVLLVTEAGGKVSDFAGGDNYIFGREIVATNGNIYDEFMIPTKEAFGK
ncbi:MAG: inositol monophosphatase [Bacteroidales bacterium]|nr:inositol monophosphatase [Bacteroidales bacterium]